MDMDKVDAIIEEHGSEPSALIQILLAIQKELRWLPKPALQRAIAITESRYQQALEAVQD